MWWAARSAARPHLAGAVRRITHTHRPSTIIIITTTTIIIPRLILPPPDYFAPTITTPTNTYTFHYIYRRCGRRRRDIVGHCGRRFATSLFIVAVTVIVFVSVSEAGGEARCTLIVTVSSYRDILYQPCAFNCSICDIVAALNTHDASAFCSLLRLLPSQCASYPLSGRIGTLFFPTNIPAA